MKKGISAVIAIVLILMITIALAAMAYVWFTTVFGEISEEAGESAGDVTESMQTRFSIEAAKYNATASSVIISIRNTGTGEIDLTNVAAYVDGVASEDVTTESEVLAGGEGTKIDASVTDDPVGKKVKVALKNGVSVISTVS